MAAKRPPRWHVWDLTIHHVVSPEFDDQAGAETYAQLIAGSHELVVKQVDDPPPVGNPPVGSPAGDQSPPAA